LRRERERERVFEERMCISMRERERELKILKRESLRERV